MFRTFPQATIIGGVGDVNLESLSGGGEEGCGGRHSQEMWT